jgi:ribosomal protein S18 acetylase RimI-like enzyme
MVHREQQAKRPAVALRPMSATEFVPWAEDALRVFAAGRAASLGLSFEDSLASARKLPDRLPQGPATPDMWLFVIVDSDDAEVGTLWLGLDPERAGAMFVWAIDIHEAFRGKGFGRSAMTAAEEVARGVGATAITLNVFGNNLPARSLYDSLGYEISALQMLKSLGS